jgi:cytochrome b
VAGPLKLPVSVHPSQGKPEMSTNGRSVRVWDIPTRLFHWLLVILMGFSWWSAETRHLDWHILSGIAVMALVVFRLIWGFIGGSTARFGQFVRSPMKVLAYLRSDSSVAKRPGHNPVGGYSVVLMLLLVSLQVGTGLFANDEDGLDAGPLNRLVSYDQAEIMSELHHLSFTLLQVVIAVHVLAILFYFVVRKRNLLTPMFSGFDKQVSGEQGALVSSGLVRFIFAAAIAAATAWAATKGFFID